MKNTKNNFDLLRLFAAFQVAFSHASSHLDYPNPIVNFLSLFPGVPIFFFLSGYLIYASYESSKNSKNQLFNFYSKRFLRLFPGLWVCLIFSCLIVFISGYLADIDLIFKDTFLWIIAQSTLFQFYNVEFLRGFGVGALNGALWTISVELQFYLLMPLVYLLMDQKKLIILLVIFFFIILNLVNSHLNSPDNIFLEIFNVTFAPWFYMFLFGAFLAKFKGYISSILRINILFLFLAITIMYYGTYYLNLDWGNKINPVGYILLISIIIHFAFRWPGVSDRILKKNDISYGIYIYHMPVINYILYIYGPGIYQFLVSVFITLIVATLSWFLVERPCLRLKKNALRKN